jgi:hypothetical protein
MTCNYVLLEFGRPGKETRAQGKGWAMPSWVVGVVVTFVLSAISAFAFLELRFRRSGYVFGPRAKKWAITIIMTTAVVSTGSGIAIVAVSHHMRAAYVGLVLPSGLWLGKASAQQRKRRGSRLLKPLAVGARFPLDRLYDRMGDDLEAWCNARLAAVSKMPQWVSDAAKYYYDQVASRVKDKRAREELDQWRESIEHKISVVRLINLETTSARLDSVLQSHPSTQGMRKYAIGGLPRLASRLEVEAQNELQLFLASVYRLGYHKLLIYPYRALASARIRRAPDPSADTR